MNSHRTSDDVFDLGLNHSLKNWVDRKSIPAGGRDQLLAAAAQQNISSSKRKHLKFNFGWSFRIQENWDGLIVRPVYGYTLESIYPLKANMAIL